MKQDKKGRQELGRDQKLKGVDKRIGKDSLKKDVGLTDKKGDNLRQGKQSGSDEFINKSGKNARGL